MSKRGNWQAAGLLVPPLLALALIGWLVTAGPARISAMFVVSGLAVGSLYALGGIGLVVLFRATGVLNFANGAIGAFAALLAWQLAQWGVPSALAWLGSLGAALVLSLVYGMSIAPGLAWRGTTVKAVASLGYALVLLGITGWLWDDTVRSLSLPTDALGVRWFGLRVTATRMIVIVAALAITLGVTWYLHRSRTGLLMRSLAAERDLSALIGVPVRRVEVKAWAMAGLIAGFTGLCFGNLVRLEPVAITFMVIPSIAAAVCGRLENLWAVLFWGLAIGVIESVLTLSPALKSVRAVAPFVIAAIVLVWSSRGARLSFHPES